MVCCKLAKIIGAKSMFTGIIETVGVVREIVNEGSNKHFKIKSPISTELQVDQSVSHNGICLTVTKVENGMHWVTAVAETFIKTNLNGVTVGSPLNLERSMKADGRFDGHIVQGHVDTTATVISVTDAGGSHVLRFAFLESENSLIVEKGSICVNGVSLTCFNVEPGIFEVAIIPYTWEHTTLRELRPPVTVNLEFDVIGKYVQKMMRRN